METRNIRVILAYDGTDYCGWQRQASGRTGQQVVEEALERLHGRKVRVRVAGRTDSGVHASGQVINFRSDVGVPEERFAQAMNGLLPPDIRALRSDRVADDFDARFNARVRVYKYFIACSAVRNPAECRYAWWFPRGLDVSLLNRYSARLVGSRDFSTFAAAGDTSVSRVREVYSAAFYPENGYLVFKIAANAFLYRMVRSLVGTMVEMEGNRSPASELGDRLNARSRDAAGRTAPPVGLFLHKVLYDERYPY